MSISVLGLVLSGCINLYLNLGNQLEEVLKIPKVFIEEGNVFGCKVSIKTKLFKIIK